MPGIKASKDRLILLLGMNSVGDLKSKPVLIYYSENPRTLRIMSIPLCLCFLNETKKTGWENVFVSSFTENFQAHCWELLLRKNITFEILLLNDYAPGHPRALREMYNEIDVVFMPVHTTSILQPMGQGVILTFKSYYIRNTFHKAIAAIDSNSSDGSGKSKLNIFWNGKNAIKSLCNFWEEVKTATLIGV